VGNNFPHDQCCYVITAEPCAGGRPLRIDGSILTAHPDGWGSSWIAEEVHPDVDGLDVAARLVLARRWTRDALLEHASVASFARFALELMAVGAPADLVAGAHAAALDEVRHAQLCFAMANAYGASAAPSAIALPAKLELATDLAGAAAAAVIDGCIGETLAALVAAEELAGAHDTAVRAVLSAIADDEARHAELAWRFVVWAFRRGDGRVRGAITRAFDEAVIRRDPREAIDIGRPQRDLLERHGWLDPASRQAATERGLREVVLPCARALLRSNPLNEVPIRPPRA
jgi:hypothetical protein